MHTAVLREAWATLPESSSRPLPATLAQSRNLAHASLKTAVCHVRQDIFHIGENIVKFPNYVKTPSINIISTYFGALRTLLLTY